MSQRGAHVAEPEEADGGGHGRVSHGPGGLVEGPEQGADPSVSGAVHVRGRSVLGTVVITCRDGGDDLLVLVEALASAVRILVRGGAEPAHGVLDLGQEPLEVGIVRRLPDRSVELEVQRRQGPRWTVERRVHRPVDFVEPVHETRGRANAGRPPRRAPRATHAPGTPPGSRRGSSTARPHLC